LAQMKNNYCFIILFLFMKISLVFGAEKQLEFSVQPALYADNNIFEKVHQEKIQDEYLQLLICGKYKKNIRSQRFNLQYIGNWQNYQEFSQENKIYNRISFSYINPLKKSFIIFLNVNIYRKDWLQNDRHYTNGYATTGFIIKTQKFHYQVDLHAGNFIFSYFPEFNNHHVGARTKLTYLKNRFLSFNIAAAGNYYMYQNDFIDRRRYDSNGMLSFGFEYRQNMIFGIDVQALHQPSNYDFLVHNSLIISPYLSTELAGFYIQLLAKYNYKHYLNKIQDNQISLVYPDPESNVNNQLFFGMEREIGKNLSLSGKVMFFSSEYKYQADFYEKLLVGIGMKYDF